MSKKILIAVVIGILNGCAAITGALPTFEYCQTVNYERTGNKQKFTAECTLPIGGGSLPIPLPGIP